MAILALLMSFEAARRTTGYYSSLAIRYYHALFGQYFMGIFVMQDFLHERLLYRLFMTTVKVFLVLHSASTAIVVFIYSVRFK